MQEQFIATALDALDMRLGDGDARIPPLALQFLNKLLLHVCCELQFTRRRHRARVGVDVLSLGKIMDG